MKLNIQPFAIAAASTAAIFYTLCSAFFAFMPVTYLRHKAQIMYLVQIDRYIPDFQFSVGAYIYGLASTFLCTYITALVFVVIYNYFVRK
jgi:hypothetical protein